MQNKKQKNWAMMLLLEIENLEVLFFSTRLLRGDLFELPILAHFKKSA
jgi:hypothetical protein